MPSREIPLGQWVAFLENFRRVHEGWLIVLEVIRGGTIETVVRNMALSDIQADLRNDRKRVISISAGDESEQCLTHLVQRPIRIEVQTTEEGAYQVVRIDSEGEQRTLLRFRTTTLPENLDRGRKASAEAPSGRQKRG